MKHVIDVGEAGTDAAVLTESGSSGIFGRGLLSEASLEQRLDDDETPVYVLRNKKRGVTVERSEATREFAPDGNHSGVALVTDVRLVLAAGRSDGDHVESVPLGDVVDVSTEDGLLGGALVVETVEDEAYRFPCRGDLEPVADYLDAAVGIWTRAERRLERARSQCEELRSSFESGDFDVVLAAAVDVTTTLEDAREQAAALDGASERIDERAAAVRSDLDALERRAHAERAEQARERGHVRWDDHEYEAACDHFDDAAAAYDAAADVDGARPGEELLAKRRETLAVERERLVSAPVERARHAVEVAESADDPATAVEWWESAVERYETALSLDWGRDERRFDGDVDQLREDLADAARTLVEAHCTLAREHIANGDEARESDRDAARAAYERAAASVESARAVARERAPDATDEIDRVEATLADRPLERGGGDSETDDGGGDGHAGTAQTDTTHTVLGPEGTDSEGGSSHSSGVTVRGGSSSETGAPVVGDSDDGDGTGGTGDASTDGDSGESVTEEGQSAPTDPTALDPETFSSAVAELFMVAGWTTTTFDAGADRQYDLLAETDVPVGVAVCVWTIHPERVEAVDAATVERYVASLDRAENADAAVVASAAPLSPTARERVAEHDVKLLDVDALRDLFQRFDVVPETARDG